MRVPPPMGIAVDVSHGVAREESVRVAFRRMIRDTLVAQRGIEVKRTETAYDTLSRPVATLQSPAGVTSTLSYATASSKISVAVIEHAGLTTTVTYDEFGRETERTVTGTGVALTGAVTQRDAEGRRTAWSIGSLEATATYDAAGKLVSQTTTPGIAATYTYDPETARKTEESVTLAGQGTVASAYTYTDAGRLSGAEIGAGVWGYVFDERGNLTGAVTGGVATTFTFDGNDRLETSTAGGVTTNYSHELVLGRRTSQTT
ncbi:MAG: hypothetical protein IBX63_10585, partial [Coriobacteriia bacterium]|nr:hypothetical protein [Coriobacteriia bacterium]